MPVNGDITAGDAVIRFHQRKQRSRRALLPCERVMQVILGVVRPDDGIIHVRAGNPDPRDEIVVLCQTRRKVCAVPMSISGGDSSVLGSSSGSCVAPGKPSSTRRTLLPCAGASVACAGSSLLSRTRRSSYSAALRFISVFCPMSGQSSIAAPVTAIAAARKAEGESACFCFMMFLPSHRQYSFLPCMA